MPRRSGVTTHKICEICGKRYTATGMRQRYCQECGPAARKKVRDECHDRFLLKHGARVGVGRGNAQGKGRDNHGYRFGTNTYQEEKLASMTSYFCEMCGADLNEIVHKDKQKWCVHHIDQDRKHNEQSNWLLLCKSCHQKVHKAADHLNKGREKK
jgi:hypothetical protein